MLLDLFNFFAYAQTKTLVRQTQLSGNKPPTKRASEDLKHFPKQKSIIKKRLFLQSFLEFPKHSWDLEVSPSPKPLFHQMDGTVALFGKALNLWLQKMEEC